MMSSITPTTKAPPVAVRTGADLKAARERLNLSLADMAESLRIRLAHLEALEEGRISALPGNAYALAFVRTYATALGLDANAMVLRFKAEATEVGRHTELVFPVPMAERGLPAGALLLVGLILAVGAYAGWYRLSGEGRLPAETALAIPERLAPLAEQALPPTSTARTQVASPGPAAPTSVADAETPGENPEQTGPQIVLPDPATPGPSPSSAPPVVAVSPTSAAAAQLPSSADGSAAPSAAAAAGPPTEEGRIVLRANADAWMQVKDHGGAILLNRTLKAGETWAVPPRADLLLTTGNAGGTDVLVDGSPTPSLGGSGAVRRDLSLDPDQIKLGRMAGAAPPQVAASRARQ